MKEPQTKKRWRSLFAGLLTAVLLLSSVPLHASGSYTGRPPQPGAFGRVSKHVIYAFGQRIYLGKEKLEAANEAGPQRDRLEALQSLLPEETAREKDLTALAGKLDEQQIQALEFFVNERYGKKQ